MSFTKNSKKKSPSRQVQSRNLLLVQEKFFTTPPEISEVPIVYSRRLRFLVKAGVANTLQSVTFRNLGDAVLVASTSTTAYQMFAGVRLKSVEIWSQNDSSSIPTTVSLVWNGSGSGTEGNRRSVSDTSITDRPAYVHMVAPADSLMSKWQLSTETNTAFGFVAPSNSIIDVHVTYRNSPGEAFLTANPGVGLAPGAMYFRGLDGQPIASTNYLPMTYPTAQA